MLLNRAVFGEQAANDHRQVCDKLGTLPSLDLIYRIHKHHELRKRVRLDIREAMAFLHEPVYRLIQPNGRAYFVLFVPFALSVLGAVTPFLLAQDRMNTVNIGGKLWVKKR